MIYSKAIRILLYALIWSICGLCTFNLSSAIGTSSTLSLFRGNTDPITQNVRLLGSYGGGGSIRSVFAAGGLVYLGDESQFIILDTSNPTSPAKLGSYTISGDVVYDIFVDGTLAYLATGNKGLQILDISNPADPKLAGYYQSFWLDAKSVQIINTTAYVANSCGIALFDVSDFKNIQFLGEKHSSGEATDVFVSGTTAYVTCGIGGLQIFNVSNPTAPKKLGSYSNNADAVFVVGSTAYIARSGGLGIINVANPAQPQEKGAYQTQGWGRSIFVDGFTAFLADSIGLRVLNIANPAQPTEVGFFDKIGSETVVHAVGSILYVGNEPGGLSILLYPPCYRLTLKHSGTGEDPVPTLTNSNHCDFNEYFFGELISINASPALGWKVGNWSGTNNNESNDTTNTLLMPATDHEVMVNYIPICHALILSYEGEGKNPDVTPSNSLGCLTGQFVANQPITLTAKPDSGSRVISWVGTTNDSLITTTNTLVMPAKEYAVKVKYGLDCYPLTLIHWGLGNDPIASPSQSDGCQPDNYHRKEQITLTAMPNKDWTVMSWSGLISVNPTATVNLLGMPTNAYTVAVHYGELPIAGPGDSFELDNTCSRSHLIASNGSEVQQHSFHQADDEDWIRFDTVAGSSYRIDVTVPQTSTADVILETRRNCISGGGSLGNWNGDYTPNARLVVSATLNAPVYVRIVNQDGNVAGADAVYYVSVNRIGDQPRNRAAIIVAGRVNNDPAAAQIEHVASQARELFLQNGYSDENIYFLANNPELKGYDASATLENLKNAITQWAFEHVNNGVLNLYLVDHGSPEKFYLDDNRQLLTPQLLDDWLTTLETNVSGEQGVTVNVFIEACESGSFIDKPDSISGIGRVIVTSSSATLDAHTSSDGAYFSDQFITSLRGGNNLLSSFEVAQSVADNTSTQNPWLDGDGDGIPNEADDRLSARQRGFAIAGTLPGDTWPPHIFKVESSGPVKNGTVRIQATVRDDVSVKFVWVVVHPPSYAATPPAYQLLPEPFPALPLQSIDSNGHWQADIGGLQEPGIYRLLVQASDESGLIGVPFVFEIDTTPQKSIFLPLISR